MKNIISLILILTSFNILSCDERLDELKIFLSQKDIHNLGTFINGRNNELMESLSPKRVLILSDGPSPEGESSLTEIMSQYPAFSNAEIFQTDLIFDEDHPEKDGNITRMYLDNRESFPFPSDHFDLILGRSIFCTCNPKTPDKACGGMDYTDDECTQNFVHELYRVLNKKNPRALLYVTGDEFSATHPKFSVTHEYRATQQLIYAIRSLNRVNESLRKGVVYVEEAHCDKEECTRRTCQRNGIIFTPSLFSF